MSPTPFRSRAFPDLARAPFAVHPGDSPARVAEDIVASFGAVAGLERRAARVFAAAAERVGLVPGHPLRDAGHALAEAMDRDLARMGANAYHNSQHVCEVLLSALFLALKRALPPARQARLLAAAVAHDFCHDGSVNGPSAFRLEQLAVDRSGTYFADAGVEAPERAAIAALILATEAASGVPYARRCFRLHHLDAAPPEPRARASRPTADGAEGPLALLMRDAQLAFDAMLLAEADVLPSAGLTLSHALLCQERLHREDSRIGCGLADKQAFVEGQVPGFLVAGFFTPNLQRIRREIRRALADAGGGAG